MTRREWNMLSRKTKHELNLLGRRVNAANNIVYSLEKSRERLEAELAEAVRKRDALEAQQETAKQNAAQQAKDVSTT